MKIYQKLIIVFSVLGLLLGFVGYMSLLKAKKTLQEQIGKESLLLADQILMEIDDEVYHRIKEMQTYAADTSLVNEASRSNEEFDKIPNIQNYINKIDRDWKDKKDTPFIRSILNNKLSQKLKKHLEFCKQIHGYDVFGEMYMTNKYGAAIASTERLSDYLQADDEWYPKAVAERDFWVDDLEYDESSNTFSIGVVINLYDENGKFAGIFKGALNVEDIKYIMDLILSQSQYKSMKPYLVDRNGIAIFSRLDQSLKQEGRDIRLAEFGTDISLRKPVAQVIKGNKGYILNTEEGKELLSVFSHSSGFRDFKGLGWSIIIDFETDEIFGPVTKLEKGLALIFVFALIIATLVGSSIVRAIAKPIAKLRVASINIGKGKLDTRVDVKSKDEIGQLAVSFNRMAEDLKKSNIALQESEARFRGVLSSLYEAAILVCDKNGKILALWGTPEMDERYGISMMDAVGSSIREFLPPEQAEQRLAEIRRVFDAGEKMIVENIVIVPSGNFWHETSFAPMRNDKGEITAVVGFIRDITERKQREEKLRMSMQKLALHVEQTPLGVIEWNLNFEVKEWNPASEKIFGFKQEEALGQHASFIVPENLREYVDGVWNELLNNLGGTRSNNENVTKDGSTILCEWYNTPLIDTQNKVIGVASLVMNITERKRAEDELGRYRKHLEEMVKERTRELEKAQEELVRKERLAVLGQLTATVSHEIRNPLGTIRNTLFSIGDAIDHNEMDRVHRSLKLAERNIKRCDRIINEMLNFARNWKTKLERTDVDSWIGEVLDEQEFPEDIECVRDLHSGIALPIDREYMRLAINNVVTNAVQALGEDNSINNRLTVESIATSERLELRFIDTGHGIPEEIMEKVFDPMFSTKSFGIGLGVPIINNIMKEHQGGVELKSKVGHGTTVTLWLPIPKLEEKG